MQGYLDGVGARTIRGWAAGDDGAAPELLVSVNGKSRGRFRPDLVRPDLAAAFGEDPRIGFNVDLGGPILVGDVLAVTDPAGEPLPGSPLRVSRIEGGKVEKSLAMVERSMKILEIGPSFSPIAPRSQGWNSFSLDHATQEELRAKYAGQQPVENIEPVDFVWRGGPISDAVPIEMHGTFDVVIASHVIEHFPDPIGFYLSAAELLKDGGLVALVVPDKRVMFDFFKPLSLTSDLLTAHVQGRTRHTRKVTFDNVAYNVFDRGDVAWFLRPVGSFSFPDGFNALAHAKSAFDSVVEDESAAYVDFHHTIYTPSSFELIILELGQLGVIPFQVSITYPLFGCEFYVTLRKGEFPKLDPALLTAERLRLLKATVREQAEQARWLLDD